MWTLRQIHAEEYELLFEKKRYNNNYYDYKQRRKKEENVRVRHD